MKIALPILIVFSGFILHGQELRLTDPVKTNFVSWRIKNLAEEFASKGPEVILDDQLLDWDTAGNDFNYFTKIDSDLYARRMDYKELFDFVHQQFSNLEIAEITTQAVLNNKTKQLPDKFVNGLNQSKRQKGGDKRAYTLSNPIVIRNLFMVREKWVEHPDVWIEITTKIYMKMSEFEFIELKTLDKVSSGL